MTRRTPIALAIAALFLLTTLPSPPAQARNVEVCLMRGLIDMEGNEMLGLDVDDDVWPNGGAWNPHPPWEGYADFYGSAGFDGRCAYATAGVGAFGLEVSTDPPRQSGAKDSDGDGMGDDWTDWWEQFIGTVLQPLVDTDDDGLLNVREFQWQLVPVCLPYNNIPLPDGVDPILNCDDHEADPLTGLGGDGWFDGPEVAYWNNPQNDNIDVSAAGVAFYDPDRLLDTDGDLVTNLNDTDSDDDNLFDGAEIYLYQTYPELLDSDCSASATVCTRSGSVTSIYDPRQGAPGSGDGLNDDVELAKWNLISPSAWGIDYDNDGIASNLIDPDGDGDGLLDGEEVLVWLTKLHVRDTDLDGLIDGDEAHIYATTPTDWDTDNDLMPDGWEVTYHLNPRVHDAALDADADGYANGAEYAHARPAGWNEVTQGPWTGGTNPLDADTEGDGLLDGEEVLTHQTNPLHWDTDSDGLPDPWELQYGFNPRNVNNAQQDPDEDFFNQGNDATVEKPWPNLDEYRYARPPDWNEFSTGPWQLGTDPLLADTDNDVALDGYEAYYNTDARLPIPEDSDDDLDGLTWAQEAKKGTNPVDADTDGDGLCDGGRASNCLWPGGGGIGNQPGERDYRSVPWDLDSDDDGLGDAWEAIKWDEGASGTAQDVDGDFINGVIDRDSDGDGLSDGAELNTHNTDMILPDTDGDQLKDGDEVQVYFTYPLDTDTDNDGLLDGNEVLTHRTKPAQADTDWDSLSDGAEVTTHGTNPLAWDSDGDWMMDSWEVAKGTQATVKDGDKDVDADGLTNYREYQIGSHPNDLDTDDDGMQDGYEDRFGLNPTSSADKFTDLDSDGLTNFAEFEGRTSPANADSDSDGAQDGWEKNTAGTDPLNADSDADGFNDGPEHAAWIAASYPWSADGDGDTLNGLQDPDSDNDGLSDFDELTGTRSKPHDPDTDDDTLTDFDEVVTYHGWFDPTKADTDDDTKRDDEEPKVDPLGDEDVDGLSNQDEDNTYGTDYQKSDSDCDGADDGPELTYWGAAWNSGGNRLLIGDVDGDGLKDGVELGTVGTPSQAMYKTNPGAADSDADGLNDADEATNNVEVHCDESSAESMDSPSSGQFPSLPGLPEPPMIPVPLLYKTMPNGLVFGQDENGWYIRGGYGVKLYLVGGLSPEELVGGDPRQPAGGPAAGTNGKTTSPNLWDTEGDGLNDGQEVNVVHSNPALCDSDNDGLGDALEIGVPGTTANPDLVCTHLDSQTSTTTNPNNADTDGDGLLDGVEDATKNGRHDVDLILSGYCAGSGETNPAKIDTDNDGVSDSAENSAANRGFKTDPFCFDTDKDGLSDGLELGIRDSQKTADTVAQSVSVTGYSSVYGRTVMTFQPWQASGSSNFLDPTKADSDGDGMIDGLEDWTPNGIYLEGAYELNPESTDVDGDSLMDGRELRIFGTYNFPTAMQAWGGSPGELAYDPGNPWETNPRLPVGSTTSDTDGDGVGDEQDLNPRANAGLAIGFLDFRTKERPDGCCNGYQADGVDLKLDFTVSLPLTNGDSYRLSTPEITDIQAMNPTSIDLTGRINNDYRPTVVSQAVGALDVLNLDLPEDVGLGLDLNNLNVQLTLHGKDIDAFGFAGSNEDLDFDSNADQTDIVQSYLLDTEGASTIGDTAYRSWGNPVQHEGEGEEHGFGGEIEAVLYVKFGDSAPTYFISGLRQIRLTGSAGPPAGNCLGTSLGTPNCPG